MLKKLFYPAVFTPEDDGGYSVAFPDLDGCFTQGETIEDAYKMAFDALGLAIDFLESEKRTIPSPSTPNEIKLNENEFVVIIEFDMLEYQKKHNSKSVKKTLTIPQWLNEEAMAKNINFSQVLQEALLIKCQSQGFTVLFIHIKQKKSPFLRQQERGFQKAVIVEPPNAHILYHRPLFISMQKK